MFDGWYHISLCRPLECSLPVTILFCARPCFFSSLINNRLAALVSRRSCTISSRTIHPGRRLAKASAFDRRSSRPPRPDARYPFATAPFCAIALRRSHRICGSSAGSFRRTRQCRAPAAFLPPAAGLTETEIQPDGMGDDLWWETMVLVADGRRAHHVQLSVNR